MERKKLCEWAMFQRLPLDDTKWVEETCQFNEDLIKSYNDDCDEEYFLEVDVQYPENLHNLHNDLPFSPERMKIEKVEKLVANLHDKEEYVIDITNSKQALNRGLILKSVIKFNQNARLKPYIDMNTKLIKKQKIILKEIFLS